MFTQDLCQFVQFQNFFFVVAFTRTIPMLPERLCNFICSLRPDEEKLAFSVIFNMNEKGEVKDSRIVHTIIKSDRRFTYEEAQKVIETGEGRGYDKGILWLSCF